MDTESGSLTLLIDSLVKTGWLKAGRQGDRRKALLYLTEAGEEKYQKMMKTENQQNLSKTVFQTVSEK